jgi:hypothetical protein
LVEIQLRNFVIWVSVNFVPPPPIKKLDPFLRFDFPLLVPKLLVKAGDRDLDAEKKHIEARKKRKLNKEAKEKDSTANPAADTATSAAPTPAATNMPPPSTPSEVSTPTTKRKKGDKDGKVAHFSEEAQHRASTSTAQFFTGNLGKKYSWLQKGPASSPGTPSRPRLTAGAGMSDRLAAQNAAKSTVGTPTTPAAPKEDPALESKKSYKKLGLLREPTGVQLKDLIGVLERQGKERRALMRVYSRLTKEK